MPENLKYGLSEATISEIVSILKRNQRIHKVILFGSRAKGTFSNGSDIDLALVGIDLGLNDILDASVGIEELTLPYKFDLVIYDRIKEVALINHIKRVGIVLFDRLPITINQVEHEPESRKHN